MPSPVHLGTVELLGTRHLGTAGLLGVQHLGTVELDGIEADDQGALAGAATGHGTAQGGATLDQTGQGNAVAAGNAVADAALDQAIAGDAAGAGDAAADAALTNDQQISGNAAGAGDAAADATLDQAASAAATGAGDATAGADLDQAISGDAAGAGDAAADATSEGDQALAGDAAGAGDAVADATLDQAVSGAATGAGGAAGGADLDQAAGGGATGSGEATAPASLDQSLSGTAAGSGDAAADATVSGGAPFSPADLFGAGELGFYFEPALDNCYTDSAGSSPVTADGDRLGRMDDLSGNSNHVTQSSASNRAVFKTLGGVTWIENFDANTEMNMPVGCMSGATASYMICAISSPTGIPTSDWQRGPFSYWNSEFSPTAIPSNNDANFAEFGFGNQNWGAYPSLGTASHYFELVNSGTTAQLFVNGLQVSTDRSVTTGWQTALAPKFMGAFGTSYSSRVYGALGIGRVPSTAERAALQAYFSALG